MLALLDQLHGIARKRGLDLSRLPPYPQENREPEPDEAVTVSDLKMLS